MNVKYTVRTPQGEIAYCVKMAGYKILSVEDTDEPLATGWKTIAE